MLPAATGRQPGGGGVHFLQHTVPAWRSCTSTSTGACLLSLVVQLQRIKQQVLLAATGAKG
jgi:hypothetical protein